MIVGMGAAALVVESAASARERGIAPICEVLSAVTANSAYHGTRLDVRHISAMMETLVAQAESRHGVTRALMAPETVFVSHETYTPARGGSASAEVHALRSVFGEAAGRIVMANTKGFTGHAMAVGIEDVVAVRSPGDGPRPARGQLQGDRPRAGGLEPLARRSVSGTLRVAPCRGLRIADRHVARCAGSRPPTVAGASPKTWASPTASRTRPRSRPGWASSPAMTRRSWRWIAGRCASRTRVRPPGSPGLSRPAAAVPAELEAAFPPAPEPGGSGPIPCRAASAADPVQDRILVLVAEKTGYPRDMLALDLDLEADLGIDTVKQAELFASVREEWGIPRDEKRKLRDYPTLQHVIAFVHQMRPDLGTTSLPTAPVVALPRPVPAAEAPAAAVDSVREKVLALVTEKTGYPPDMLDLDLDLEADLGIDTVKQAELFASVRQEWDIPRDEKRKLRDYPTLRHVVAFVHAHAARSQGCAAADTPAAAPIAPAPVEAAPGPPRLPSTRCGRRSWPW